MLRSIARQRRQESAELSSCNFFRSPKQQRLKSESQYLRTILSRLDFFFIYSYYPPANALNILCITFLLFACSVFLTRVFLPYLIIQALRQKVIAFFNQYAIL